MQEKHSIWLECVPVAVVHVAIIMTVVDEARKRVSRLGISDPGVR